MLYVCMCVYTLSWLIEFSGFVIFNWMMKWDDDVGSIKRYEVDIAVVKCKLQNLTLLLPHLHSFHIHQNALLIPLINMYKYTYTDLLISKMVICYGNINISESLTYNPPNLFLHGISHPTLIPTIILSSISFFLFFIFPCCCCCFCRSRISSLYSPSIHIIIIIFITINTQHTDSIFIVVHVVK